MTGRRRRWAATGAAAALAVAAVACSPGGGGEPAATTGAPPVADTTAPTTSTTRPPLTGTSTRLQDVDPLIERGMAATAAPGALVSLYVPGRLDWERGFGTADLATAAPMDPAMHVRIAGLTTMYTCAALLEVAEDGVLSVDDPISTFIEGVPNGSATLAQLCQNVSGIPDYRDNPGFVEAVAADPTRVFTPFDLFGYAGRAAQFPVGSGWYPSATNAVLVGLAIEEATERPVGEIITERILRPRGLTSTSYPAATDTTLPEPAPRGYWAPFEGGPPGDYTALSPSVGSAAGAMISTLRDLRAFVPALAERLYGGPAEQAAQAQSLPVGGDLPGWFRTGMGRVELGPFLASAGDIPGFGVAAVFDRDTGASAVVALNNSTVGSDEALFLAAALVAAVVPDRDRLPFTVEDLMAFVAPPPPPPSPPATEPAPPAG